MNLKIAKKLSLLFVGMLAIPNAKTQSLFCSKDSNTRYENFVVNTSNISQIIPYSISPVTDGYWFGGLIHNTSGGVDFFLGKLNDSAKIQFVKSYGSSLKESGYPIPIATLKDGGCLIAGRTDAGNGLAEILRVSSSGKKLWSKQTPKITDIGYDAIRGVFQDNKSNILAVGTGIQKTGKANLLVYYLDTSGKTLWSRNIDFGGSQHHFNAIAKKDTVFVMAGWCTVNSGISPIVALVGESGSVINSFYSESAQTTTYSDVVVSPKGTIYLLGYTGGGSSQYMHVAAMRPNGKVLWRKYLGYGTDYGNSLMFENNQLWMSGNTRSFGGNTREYFCVLDTNGNLMNYGGLYYDNLSFVTRHQGKSTNRALKGGVVAVGSDNSVTMPHISFLQTNPCDTGSCANKLIGKPFIDNLDRTTGSTPSLKIQINGDLQNVDMSEIDISVSSTILCSINPCNFNLGRTLDTIYKVCSANLSSFSLSFSNTRYSVLWWDGDTSRSKTINKSGKYWLQLSNSCGSRRDTFEIAEIASPQSFPNRDTLICNAINPQWNVDVTQNGCSYLWNDNSTNPRRSLIVPGNHTVAIKNTCGTVNRDFVLQLGNKPLVEMPDSLSLCEGAVKQLFAFEYSDSSLGLKNTYRWNDGFNASAFWVNRKGIVKLEVTNACGTSKDSMQVLYRDCYCFSFIPNAFTPLASKGINDVWMPVFTCPIKEGWLSVYNRWGEKLVDQIPVLQGWDGTYMGEVVPEGVYAFLIHGYYRDDVPGVRYFVESGNITVLPGSR